MSNKNVIENSFLEVIKTLQKELIYNWNNASKKDKSVIWCLKLSRTNEELMKLLVDAINRKEVYSRGNICFLLLSELKILESINTYQKQSILIKIKNY